MISSGSSSFPHGLGLLIWVVEGVVLGPTGISQRMLSWKTCLMHSRVGFSLACFLDALPPVSGHLLELTPIHSFLFLALSHTEAREADIIQPEKPTSEVEVLGTH